MRVDGRLMDGAFHLMRLAYEFAGNAADEKADANLAPSNKDAVAARTDTWLEAAAALADAAAQSYEAALIPTPGLKP